MGRSSVPHQGQCFLGGCFSSGSWRWIYTLSQKITTVCRCWNFVYSYSGLYPSREWFVWSSLDFLSPSLKDWWLLILKVDRQSEARRVTCFQISFLLIKNFFKKSFHVSCTDPRNILSSETWPAVELPGSPFATSYCVNTRLSSLEDYKTPRDVTMGKKETQMCSFLRHHAAERRPLPFRPPAASIMCSQTFNFNIFRSLLMSLVHRYWQPHPDLQESS